VIFSVSGGLRKHLFPEEARDANEVTGKYYFLGHYFRQYGHFLLETLPMFSEIINNNHQKSILLPWWAEKGVRNGDVLPLLSELLEILGIPSSNVVIYQESKTIKCSMNVIPRPIAINAEILLRDPYESVLSVLVTKTQGSSFSRSTPKKIYLERRANRVEPSLANAVASYLASHGFARIQPEKLSLAEQIYLFSSADVVCGFSGSQLHNSIFCNDNCTLLEIGDTRITRAGLINQALCNNLSGVNSLFAEYTPDATTMNSRIGQLLSL